MSTGNFGRGVVASLAGKHAQRWAVLPGKFKQRSGYDGEVLNVVLEKVAESHERSDSFHVVGPSFVVRREDDVDLELLLLLQPENLRLQLKVLRTVVGEHNLRLRCVYAAAI